MAQPTDLPKPLQKERCFYSQPSGGQPLTQMALTGELRRHGFFYLPIRPYLPYMVEVVEEVPKYEVVTSLLSTGTYTYMSRLYLMVETTCAARHVPHNQSGILIPVRVPNCLTVYYCPLFLRNPKI